MNFRQIRFALISVSMSLCLCASTARGDLIVEFDSIQMNAGQSASIDVFIRSSDGTDVFAQYNLLFEVVLISGQGIMEFLPTDQQDNSETTAGNYVFSGDSNDFQAVRGDSIRNRITQSDFASANVAPGTDIVTRNLLGRLEINHIVTADQLATFAGAEYQIKVIAGDLTFFNLDDYDTRVAIDGASYTNFGAITVMAVPEPSSGLLLLSSLGALTLSRRKDRRTLIS